MSPTNELEGAANRGLRPPEGFAELALCGTGATSVVYRATDSRTGKQVALKRLHRQMLRSDEALARLRRELKALGQLNHPSIVRVVDVISWDSDPTIVMDYIPGDDLKERLDHEGPLPMDMAERVARTLLDVLATTHGAGIVHRDLKPQNIRITPDGEIFLLDFGSARLDATSQLTGTGTTVGTPEYMAPELFVGSVYDPRVDVYGVGATLFECLTGRPPQIADSLAELAYLRSHEPIAKVASVREDTLENLAQVVDRCLERLPEARYSTAALAVWALDHPEEERLFQARRSSHPLCVHCHLELAPTAIVCPQCKINDPFAYDPGFSHVEIDTVEDPQRFIEKVTTDAPELASRGHIRGLARRCAALSFSRQRYLSFIDRDQARRTVNELSDIGVTSHIVTEPRNGFWILPTLLLLPCIPVALMLPLMERFSSFFKARHGILSTSYFSAPVWPNMRRLLVVLAVLIGVVGLGFDVWLIRDSATTGFTVGLLALGVSYLIASALRLGRPRAEGSPEPGAGRALRGVVSLSRRESEPTATQLQKRVSPATYVVFLLGFILLIPLELFVLGMESEILHRMAERVGVVSEQGGQASSERRGVPRELRPETSPDRAAPGLSRAAKARIHRARRQQRLEESRRQNVGFAWAVGPAPTFLCLILLGLLFRRRARIARETESIMADLDWDALEPLLQRTPPVRGDDIDRPAAVGHVALAPSGGQFSKAAITRAADLAVCLTDEEAHRLQGAIANIRNEERSASIAAKGSLLSRCIMEADREASARLQFLALEGQLEAQAATEWARRLREGSS